MLTEQRDRTADQRRIVSICDFLRVELLDTASALNDAIELTRATLEGSTGSQHELRRRARRRVVDAREELKAAIARAMTSRERWIERVDVDQSNSKINETGTREVTALRSELEKSVTDVGGRLDADLKRIAIDVADDWSEFDAGGFRDLGGRGALWGNRAVKVGARVAAGLGGLAVGVKIGAVVGTTLGPGPGNAIGAGVGAISDSSVDSSASIGPSTGLVTDCSETQLRFTNADDGRSATNCHPCSTGSRTTLNQQVTVSDATG